MVNALSDGLKIYDLEVLLGFMRQHGSSVLLNWGEDNDQWECSWIVSGERFTAHAGTSFEAARKVVRKVAGSQNNA